jgi:hypothetical protein
LVIHERYLQLYQLYNCRLNFFVQTLCIYFAVNFVFCNVCTRNSHSHMDQCDLFSNDYLEKSQYLHHNPGSCTLPPYLHAIPPAVQNDVGEVTTKRVAVNNRADNANQNNDTPY